MCEWVCKPIASLGTVVFAAASPKLWNSLPAGLRQTGIGYKQFKGLLMTYLFAL